MTKLEKLYQRALTSPGSARFSDLDRLLTHYGFTCRQPRGGSSHFVYERGEIVLTVPKHGSDAVKPVYVKQVIGALTALRAQDVVEAEEEEE